MDNILEMCISSMQKFNGLEITNSCIIHEHVSINFIIQGMNFTILTNCDANSKTMPFVITTDANSSMPHFLLIERVLGDKELSVICLYENEHYISHLFTVEEKVEFCISQLFKLLNLTKSEIESEYQKEFLYYWNRYVKNSFCYSVYLENECSFSLLEIFSAKEEHMILLHPNIHINKQYKDKWKPIKNKAAIFLNINDASGIIPPHRSNIWGVENILDIVDNKQLQRLSHEAYKYFIDESYYHKSIIMIFKLNDLIFGCEVSFKNKGVAKLMDKLRNNYEQLLFLYTDRCDFHYLNSQIGNDTTLAEKKVAIIGAGSLGSYIASEIVKSGVKNLLLVDNDKLEADNILRHHSGIGDIGYSKVIPMTVNLQRFHPEVTVAFNVKRLNADNISEVLSDEIDVVIFAGIGSDAQLACNKALRDVGYTKPVLYSWLEGDGRHGHVLGINYANVGCFECLFIDGEGKKTPNKLNQSSYNDITIIRNGCGGVRIAYGNSILLQTTALVLDAFRHIISTRFTENFAFSVADNTFSKLKNSFFERNCGCCNDSN